MVIVAPVVVRCCGDNHRVAYDQSVIDAILERASQVKDPRKRDKYTRAALQTGIVESGLQNLDHGDADSEGWRQERKSLYPNPTNVTASVDRFFNEAAQLDKGQASWQLAADVQRPAAQYRGRYKQVASQAASLLKGAGASRPAASGSTPVAAPGSSGSSQAAAPVLGDPGQAPDVTSLLASLLSQPAAAPQAVQVARPGFAASPALPGGVQLAAPQGQQEPQQAGGVDDALSLLGSLRGTDPAVADPVAAGADSVGQEPVAVTVRKQRAAMKAAGIKGIPTGTAQFEGKTVAAWIAPALEYARQQGWKGTVNSGYRSFAEQQRIYNSGVRPAAVPGTSNHEGEEYPRGAVDVSDAAQLSQILKNSPYRQRLIWAGSKDPVHFSHPHNGSY